jgi:hypothetical protein
LLRDIIASRIDMILRQQYEAQKIEKRKPVEELFEVVLWCDVK